MTSVLSPNTQAILLLTAPLIAGRGASTADLLTAGEYKRLARHLREIKRQPAELISTDAAGLVQDCHSIIDATRLQRLLGRGFLLSQVIERWQARAIWVVSRADADYPRRIKARLREDAPAVLYGCGDRALLESGGLAVVGSRRVEDALIDYTMAVGRLAATAGKTLVSGGAKGIDQAAMRGALDAGGSVCGVLADSLEKNTMNREHRNLLRDGQLTLISPYDPNAGFNVGNAMQRNKLIYALADASLVVSSDLKKGGTWAGAVEQLEKLKFVPVYVRSTGEQSPGLDALRKKGAIAWPNPPDVEAFDSVFAVAAARTEESQHSGLQLALSEAEISVDGQASLPTSTVPDPEAVSPPSPAQALVSEEAPVMQAELSPADALYSAAREAIRRLLQTPMKDAEIAAALDVSGGQVKMWLQRLVDEGVIEKQKKPAGYVVKQSGLF